MAKEFMKSKNIAYQEFDVVSDVQAREEMIKKTGQMGVPVIDVDGKVMVGFNQKVLADLLGIKE